MSDSDFLGEGGGWEEDSWVHFTHLLKFLSKSNILTESRGHLVILVIKEFLPPLNYSTKSVLNFDHMPFFLFSPSLRTYTTVRYAD